MRRPPRPKRGSQLPSWQRTPVSVAMPAGTPNPTAPPPLSLSLPRGRPLKYQPEFVEIAKKLVDIMGATEQNIADYFGVTFVTIWRWKLRYPEFQKAVELTPERRLRIMEHSLYLRGVGYSHPAVKFFPPTGDSKVPITVPYTEYYPPDVGAMSLYLSNRDPKRWRKHLAPPEDQPAPGAAQEAETQRRAAFATMMAIIEERARRGEPPIFAKPQVTITQVPRQLEGALASAPKGNGKGNGKP